VVITVSAQAHEGCGLNEPADRPPPAMSVQLVKIRNPNLSDAYNYPMN